VQHHHESQSFTGSLPRDLTDERERILSYLISRADNFSSSERAEELEGGGYKPDASMHSIFTNIQLYGNKATTDYSYKLGRYLQGDMFPAVSNTILSSAKFYKFCLFSKILLSNLLFFV
jgi:hypothetical protein